MKTRVTMADIAKEVGVSVSTVSLVLGGRVGTRISADTSAAVKEAAERLGFRPNVAARSLRTGKTNSIAFVSDAVTTTRFASEMITGVASASEELDHVALIAETGGVYRRIEKSVTAMRERNVDGFLFGVMAARRIQIPNIGQPTVIVNALAGDYPAVLPDDYQAGRDAIDYLLAAGHERIGVIGRHEEHKKPERSVAIAVRFAGLDDALADAGLNFVAEGRSLDWEPEDGYRVGISLLESAEFKKGRVTAVVCGNDRLAFGFYRAAREKGVKIPDDVSVISFDDENLASFVDPGLTTLRLPYLEMGEIGVRLLLGDEKPPALTHVPLTMVERDSVAKL